MSEFTEDQKQRMALDILDLMAVTPEEFMTEEAVAKFFKIAKIVTGRDKATA